MYPAFFDLLYQRSKDKALHNRQGLEATLQGIASERVEKIKNVIETKIATDPHLTNISVYMGRCDGDCYQEFDYLVDHKVQELISPNKNVTLSKRTFPPGSSTWEIKCENDCMQEYIVDWSYDPNKPGGFVNRDLYNLPSSYDGDGYE
jgi:hypothetical protein